MLRLSKTKRVTGNIKASPEDFLVEEITENFKILDFDRKFSNEDLGFEIDPKNHNVFSIFILQKREWNTVQALREIAKKFRRGFKSVGFAGTKDRNAITTQLCSIYGVYPEQLQNISIKDIDINGVWEADHAIRLGDLVGNRFHVKIKEIEGNTDCLRHAEHNTFPNYFGPQRFGSRNNNVSVGLNILKGRFEEAVMTFLTDTNNELNQEAIDARNRLNEELDFKMALQYFPRYLKYERYVIEYLSRFEGNYANALRRLPRQLFMMFVHSVESYMFNKVVEERIKEKNVVPKKNEIVCIANEYGFPDYDSISRHNTNTDREFVLGNIIGYDTKEISELEKGILDDLDISVDSFKLKNIPEIRCKGSRRVMFAPFKNFEYNDMSKTMEFSLPSGSYATIFLNEFVNFEEDKKV